MPKKLSAHLKMYLSTSESQGVFGGGKWMLLHSIREHGSLRQGAASLGRSYRKAWGDIKKAEKELGFELICRTRGGSHGGGAQLSAQGELLYQAWDRFRQELLVQLDQGFERHLRPVFEQVLKGESNE